MVDDNATNRRILALQSAKWGMVAIDTDAPEKALPLLQQRALRPGHPGHAHAGHGRRAAGRAHPRGRPPLPLVLFTSLGRLENSAGLFAATLAKPLHQSQLFDTLVTLLSGQAAGAPAPSVAKPKIDATLAERHPLRILLAEDNVVNQKLALRLLQQMGYRADLASNGIEAIESARTPALRRGADGRADAGDGRAGGHTPHRREVACAIERPRIVAMTANAMQGDREECLAAGMDDYVTKPIRVDALVEALKQVRPRDAR